MKYMTNEIWYLYDRFIGRMSDPDIIAERKNHQYASSYVREHRTLEIKLPRRVGKTYFISTMARTCDAIVVVPSAYIGSEYKRSGIEYVVVKNENAFNGKKIGNLFLDEVPIMELCNNHPFITSKYTFDTTIVSLYT